MDTQVDNFSSGSVSLEGIPGGPYIREYILMSEALSVTGLSEKTLREKLSGAVPMIGRNAWFRREFFAFWREKYEEGRMAKVAKSKIITTHVENILEKLRR